MVARSRDHKALVAILIAGLLNPCAEVCGESPAAPSAAPIPDVRLDAQRRFHGVVVTGQGQPVRQTTVTVTPAQPLGSAAKTPASEARTVTTDELGRFVVPDLSGGSYRIETATGVYLCRIWTHDAAPPAAAPALLVVNDPQIERGQRPIGELFRSDALLMATVVAAAIAIPIIVHKSRDDAPEGS
jgi:hypothetical protein